ncbi:MAG: HAD family phosphatase [Clostridia bacterium]|nr:HAD family phosphatase [Clostridia bacterium]
MYILASDYDGTLNRGGISEPVREAIASFRAAGNLFGIVTGRDYWMYDTVIRENLSIDFILAMSGAMLIATDGPRAGEILRVERQDNNGCMRWIVEHVGNGYRTQVSTALVRDRVTFHAKVPEGNEKYAPLSRLDADSPDGIRAFSQMNTYCETDELARRCAAEINERWGDTVNALQNGCCIDIPPVGIDKGEGVARYAKLMGVPFDNVYCAGDHMNDYSMIARFHGLAVENAVDELKAAAEGVFPDIAAMIRFIMSRG